MDFPSQVVSKKYCTLFSAKFGPFRTRSGAVCRPCTINVRNEPVQEIFCVVKCETPPVLRWKLCEFQDRKSISISGINLIVWRGLDPWLSSIASSYNDYIQQFPLGKKERLVKNNFFGCLSLSGSRHLGGKRLLNALEAWAEPASSRHTGHFCVPHNTALFCLLLQPTTEKLDPLLGQTMFSEGNDTIGQELGTPSTP